MKHHSFSWQTSDGLNVAAQSWEPDVPLKAVICLVHGLGEHSSRYEHFAEYFTQYGFAVLAYDQRGHGKTEGKRGHTPSYSHLLEEVTELLNQAEERFPDMPRLLYGHSMGGNLVLNYCIRFRPKVEGIIVSGPWIKLAFEPPSFKVFLGKVMKNIYPSFTQANGLDPNLMSRDAETVKQYQQDDNIHHKISATLFFETFQAGYAIIERAGELQTPTLLMHGDQDGLTSHFGSRELANEASDHVTYKEWYGLYHELHNEPERGEVMKYVLDWMQQQVATNVSQTTG